VSIETYLVQTYLWSIIVNELLILGIWTLLRPGMLLGPIGDWLELRLPEMVTKPLFVCVPCMSSVWGLLFYFNSWLHVYLPWYGFIPHCIALCGLGAFVKMLDKSE